MFACLEELEMAQEEIAGFGILPSPAMFHTLCIDLEEASECLHSLLWMKTHSGKPCMASESWDDGLLYLRVPY